MGWNRCRASGGGLCLEGGLCPCDMQSRMSRPVSQYAVQASKGVLCRIAVYKLSMSLSAAIESNSAVDMTAPCDGH